MSKVEQLGDYETGGMSAGQGKRLGELRPIVVGAGLCLDKLGNEHSGWWRALGGGGLG
jgi:hypothetical protein